MFFHRPQQFWIIVKICTENEVLDQMSEILELSLTGHYDHGEVNQLFQFFNC